MEDQKDCSTGIKTCVVRINKKYSSRLGAKGITINAVSPGYVDTK